jgi:hypothetical protein
MLSVAIYANTHYWAPFTALIYAVTLQGLRQVRIWSIPRRPVGLAITRAEPLILVVMIAARAFAGPLRLPLILGIPTWCSRFTPDYRHQDLIAGSSGRGPSARDRPLRARSGGA